MDDNRTNNLEAALKKYLLESKTRQDAEHQNLIRLMSERIPDITHPDKLVEIAAHNGSVIVMRQMRDLLERPDFGNTTIPLSEVPRTEVEWLPIEAFKIPRGELTLIAGDPGKGKSFIVLDIISQLTRSGHTALILSEDNVSNTIIPRIAAMGGDLTRVRVLEGSLDGSGGTLSLKTDIDKLTMAIVHSQPDIVLLDPLASFTLGVDTLRGNETRGVLDPCIRLARQQRFALVCVVHLNKSTGTAIQRLADSMQGVAACRSAYVAAPNPYATESNKFVVAHAKANQTALGRSLGYRIVSLPDDPSVAKLEWEDEVDIDADTLLSQSLPETSGAMKSAIAKVLLTARLKAGPCPKREMVDLAAQLGVSARTVEREAKNLGVLSESQYSDKGQDTAIWSLPGTDTDTVPQQDLATTTLERIEKKVDKLLETIRNLLASTDGEHHTNDRCSPTSNEQAAEITPPGIRCPSKHESGH